MAIQASEASRIRSRLNHPIIDADGHMLEVNAVLNDYIKEAGGSGIIERLDKYRAGPGQELFDHLAWTRLLPDMTMKEKRDSGFTQGLFMFAPTTDTRYRATASLPKLFYERMDEFGLDFSVMFPTMGIAFTALPGIQDEELRRAACRGQNMYVADMYGEYADRLTPAATIPAHTPQEAIEEVEFCVKELGLKAFMFPSYIVRPIKREAGNERIPDHLLAPYHLDLYGLDSDYDYDPLWAKCVELGVAPCFHSTGTGLPLGGQRQSLTNAMFHTIGNFAETGDAVAKSLFLGGVTRRFPTLRFGFLEGGVGRGVMLYSGLIGWWEKRSEKAIRDYTDPAKIDLELMDQLVDEYGNERIKGRKAEFLEFLRAGQPAPADLPSIDDFHRCEIERPEDFRELFESHFYYGCEADDPLTVWAFKDNVNPFGAKIRAIMGSDISHADVIDPADVVPEAYELVEDGMLNDEEFKEFVFTNAVRLYGGMNRDFFKGTPAEAAAERVLAQENGPR